MHGDPPQVDLEDAAGDMPAPTTFLPEHNILFRETAADDGLDRSVRGQCQLAGAPVFSL
ncbi:MAG TPA: hypothetical protein VFW65_24145 [Pseudonocardiaceae bacterium]|nr:hypothetical protein [Pseudonocardiaceae bacterium]